MDFDSTTQNIAWFHDRYREGALIIKPPFQRKPVWVARQKCYLIESILLKLPVPEVYVQQVASAEGKVTVSVVDGQQRIRTVLQFIGSDADPAEAEFNKFILDKLPAGSRFYGRQFADLDDVQKKAFYGYKFAVRFLNTEDESEVRDMFKRLNKFLTPLNPQELRNATYSGPFADLSLQLADNEYWAENRIMTATSIRRMRDVEFVSELLIGLMHGPQGGGAALVDEYYSKYEDYDAEFPGQRRVKRLFDSALVVVQGLLPDIKDTRWSNKTDFYTLFMVIGQMLERPQSKSVDWQAVRSKLDDFEVEVDKRLADEAARVSAEAVQYVRAVEKGANDKGRRSARHEAMQAFLGEPFGGNT